MFFLFILLSQGQGDWESIGDREACVAQTLLCRRPRTVAGVTIQEHAPLAYDKNAFFIMWEGPVGKVTEADVRAYVDPAET